MNVVRARGLSAALEPPDRNGPMRGRLRPFLRGVLTSRSTRPRGSAALIRETRMLDASCARRVISALEPAEGAAMRTQMFHGVALSRSNISLNPTAR